MGCSPSHAVIINSSPTHETICLQPRIYMVSESTLCLLQDVGELKVYNIDDRNPQAAIERFRGAEDQLQNPLSFHPHLRARHKRIKAGDLQSAGSSSTTSEENARAGIEITGDDEVDEICGDPSDKISLGDNINTIQTESPDSPNAHSVTVEVYSYKQNSDGLQEGNEAKNNFENTENLGEPIIAENSGASVAVVAMDKNQTFDEQGDSGETHAREDIIVRSDTMNEPTLIAWTESADRTK